jgi:hypothetical protein
MRLSKAMETALIRISEGKWAGATPGTWRALKDRGLIEYRSDGTLLSKLTPEGVAVVAEINARTAEETTSDHTHD